MEGMENQANHPGLNFVNKETLHEVIRESIDEGWPLIAIDLIDVPEWGVITGYQNDGKELLCRTYFDQTDVYEIARKVPWVIIRLADKNPVDLLSLYHELFTDLPQILEIEKKENYSNGIHAWEQWISDLQEETILTKTAQDFNDAGFANAWIYYSLMDSRAKTAEYLELNSDKFAIAPDALNTLIKIYKNETEILTENMQNISQMQVENTQETWTPEMRKKQIEALQQIHKLEVKILSIAKTL